MTTELDTRWKSIKDGQPNYDGQFVLRINQHGHLRLGSRALNSDTLRHQWQVDGEICNTVTHYLPIPPIVLEPSHDH